MAAPAFRSYNSANRSNTTSFLCSAPAGVQDGDLLIAIVLSDGAAISAYPAGWQLLHVEAIYTGRFSILWKIAASEGASYTWTMAANATGGIQIHAFSGCDINHPIGDRTGNASNNATLTTTAGDALVVDELMVGIFVSRTSTSGSISTASGATEHSDVAHTTSRVVGVQSKALTATGSTGTMSVSVTNFNTNDTAYMLCLRPSMLTAPKVEKVHYNAIATNANSNTVTYGYTIPAGNVLVAICSYRRTTGNMATPSGWTVINNTASGADKTAVFWKVADGTESQHTFSFGVTSTTSVCMVVEFSSCSGVQGNSALVENGSLDYVNNTGVTGVQANECTLSIGNGSDDQTGNDMMSFPVEGDFEPIVGGFAVQQGTVQERGIGLSLSYRTGTQPTSYHFWPAVIDDPSGLQVRLGYKPPSMAGLFFGSNC